MEVRAATVPPRSKTYRRESVVCVRASAESIPPDSLPRRSVWLSSDHSKWALRRLHTPRSRFSPPTPRARGASTGNGRSTISEFIDGRRFTSPRWSRHHLPWWRHSGCRRAPGTRSRARESRLVRSCRSGSAARVRRRPAGYRNLRAARSVPGCGEIRWKPDAGHRGFGQIEGTVPAPAPVLAEKAR